MKLTDLEARNYHTFKSDGHAPWPSNVGTPGDGDVLKAESYSCRLSTSSTFSTSHVAQLMWENQDQPNGCTVNPQRLLSVTSP
eukprot:720283-Amphidinium_carterae.1